MKDILFDNLDLVDDFFSNPERPTLNMEPKLQLKLDWLQEDYFLQNKRCLQAKNRSGEIEPWVASTLQNGLPLPRFC